MGAAAWYGQVVSEFDLAVDELALLHEAARALDQVNTAREMIRRDGWMVPGAHGGVERLHPMYPAERDGRLAFGRLVKQLGLPHDAPAVSPLAIKRRKRG